MQATELRELNTPSAIGAPSGRADFGIPVPAVQRLRIMSATEWEEVVEEWATSLKEKYSRVQRYAGSGDLGCDVVGFVGDEDLRGVWDNYQCKHYKDPLTFSGVRIEFAKVIYYSFIGEYAPPRQYYFVAPLGLGTTLKKRITDADWLRERLLEAWDEHCADAITKTKRIPLDDTLRLYVEQFDFSIFRHVTTVEIIEGHSKTRFHATRFGGGLPDRPATTPPPPDIQQHELRYVDQLYQAYSDHLKTPIGTLDDLSAERLLVDHFHRSRQNFFSAETLRNFARDHLPENTYADLLDDLFAGVADTCDGEHADGLARVRATTSKAGDLHLSGNPLSSHAKVRDRHGMCHQLANDDRLVWVRKQ